MELTNIQKKLLYTQCPECKENELSEMDSVGPDLPFLWCCNCDATIDGAGVVEKGERMCEECGQVHGLDDMDIKTA